MAAFPIRTSLDIFRARSFSRECAGKNGFSSRESEEIAIVASELCSNIVKYGIRGSLDVDPETRDGKVVGILLVASDVGPPFRNLAMALQDGCDDNGPIAPAQLLNRGGIGAGLGAIVRFSDSLNVQYLPQGKRIIVVRYLNRPRATRAT